jgi:hypothetical protein
MNTQFGRILTAVLALSATTLPALEIGDASPVDLSEPEAAAPVLLKDAELETLLGPVALYPDALVALILPASTDAMDVVLAARWLRDGGSEASLDNQPWDESVRALARYPDVLKWMDENLSWTRQVGAAFVAQPSDVMRAVQRLREQARSAGNLDDTPQQKVIVEKEYIRIVPAADDILYVPVYDPLVVYRPLPLGWVGPAIRFATWYACGAWLRYDCNWLLHNIWIGWWGPSYYARPAWGRNPPPPPKSILVRGRVLAPKTRVWSPTPPRAKEMRPLRPVASAPKVVTQRPQQNGRVAAPASPAPRPKIERPQAAPAVSRATTPSATSRATTAQPAAAKATRQTAPAAAAKATPAQPAAAPAAQPSRAQSAQPARQAAPQSTSDAGRSPSAQGGSAPSRSSGGAGNSPSKSRR